jgi:hypothetical protein
MYVYHDRNNELMYLTWKLNGERDVFNINFQKEDYSHYNVTKSRNQLFTSDILQGFAKYLNFLKSFT